ncbi:MAG: hypothetical protein AAGA99_12845 [Actinomycetota bacterium]
MEQRELDHLRQLRDTTRRIDDHRGLYLVPTGLFLLINGLGLAIDRSPVTDIAFGVGIAAALASFVVVHRYYRRTLGRVVKAPDARGLVIGLGVVAAMVAGIAIDQAVEPPISLALLPVAVGVFFLEPTKLGHWRMIAVAVVVAAVAIAPAWWGADRSANLASAVVGAVMLLGGVLTHRALQRLLPEVPAE